jgi:anti-sigma B factor antagonist/stage II sporulation protein AA (anti-sigma F factor antagonist)
VTIAHLDIDTVDGALVVHVHGEIDLSNADDIRRQVTEAVPHDARGVVLDLADTTYLDSSGIRLLFDLAQRLQSRRQHLSLVVTDHALVRRVIVLTKLDDAVPLHDSVDAALKALAER